MFPMLLTKWFDKYAPEPWLWLDENELLEEPCWCECENELPELELPESSPGDGWFWYWSLPEFQFCGLLLLFCPWFDGWDWPPSPPDCWCPDVLKNWKILLKTDWSEREHSFLL